MSKDSGKFWPDFSRSSTARSIAEILLSSILSFCPRCFSNVRRKFDQSCLGVSFQSSCTSSLRNCAMIHSLLINTPTTYPYFRRDRVHALASRLDLTFVSSSVRGSLFLRNSRCYDVIDNIMVSQDVTIK